MIGMDNVSEVLALRIVTAAGLEPLFGPRAKMAMVGRSVSLEGEPTHLLTHSVQRDVLTRSICESCGTWEAGTFLRRVQCPGCGVVRPQGRGTKVPVEDAGKSEGFTVMVEIGVRNLPQRESVLTSYASVSERQRRSKP